MINVNDLRAMTRKNLLEYLDGKSSKKLCINTYVNKVDNTIIVRYHGTDILCYWVNLATNTEFIQLNNGGWMTSTTKHRMKRLSGLNVHQIDGDWYVSDALPWNTIPFENNMVFHRLHPDTKSYYVWRIGYPAITQGSTSVDPKQQLLPFTEWVAN